MAKQELEKEKEIDLISHEELNNYKFLIRKIT